ncbi:uncharacterized protein A1O5_08404 [Cladophialophora psammophila CBS 110553]|uniref:Ubiquitin-like domain-containing protein n=1 Tax=Cladophialophora psammophila CBS 110553 TaxID=1182543 RepID=W9WU91_9EURO|nr:uncharacterized protein A1O5_08404 [Cladophialophora psammophila CBS 110553]EXJ68610.1 hypothetical protein A1O5_08404 [Cladophialophora psammophila CBS 110553]
MVKEVDHTAVFQYGSNVIVGMNADATVRELRSQLEDLMGKSSATYLIGFMGSILQDEARVFDNSKAFYGLDKKSTVYVQHFSIFDDVRITIQVRDDNGRLYFKATTRTQFGKVCKAYCDKRVKDHRKIRFLHKGQKNLRRYAVPICWH